MPQRAAAVARYKQWLLQSLQRPSWLGIWSLDVLESAVLRADDYKPVQRANFLEDCGGEAQAATSYEGVIRTLSKVPRLMT